MASIYPSDVVYMGPQPQGFKANLAGDFFETPMIQSFVEKQLHAAYGITSVAHCPGPPAQLIEPRTVFSCSISGAPKVTTVRLKEVGKGNLFQYNVAGLTVDAADQPPGDALMKHKLGHSVILSGSAVSAYLAHQYLPVAYDSSGLTVSCPATVDLTGKKHSVCRVYVKGHNVSQRIDISIEEPNGFHELPLDAIIDKHRVQRLAEDD